MSIAALTAYTRFQPPADSLLPPREEWPTMYDLPSEDPEEDGLPDDFHYLQPQLLRESFLPPECPPEEVYVGTDINLYYDLLNPLWHKRPDWFAVLGARRARTIEELRLSYVAWQEGINPYLVIELLSPGTEDEDLGSSKRRKETPPGKWEVYEQILQVPFYVVYDRYVQKLRAFALASGRYRELALFKKSLWLPELKLNLRQWEGEFQGVEGKWLRWFYADGTPAPTLAERQEETRLRAEQEARRADQEAQRAAQETQRARQEQQRADQAAQRADEEKQRADEAEQRAQALAARLRELGIEP